MVGFTYNFADPRLNDFQRLAEETAAAQANGSLNQGYYDDLAGRRNALLASMNPEQQAAVRANWYGGAPESAATDFMGYLASQDAATRGGLAAGANPAGPAQTWASWSQNPSQTSPGGIDRVAVQNAAGPGFYSWIDNSDRIKQFTTLGEAVRSGNSGKTYDQILAERDALLGGMTDQEREYIDQSFYGNRGNKTGKLDDFMSYIRSMDGWGRTAYDDLVKSQPQPGGGGSGQQQQAAPTSTVAGGSNPVRTSVTSSTGTTPAGDAPRSRSADIISGSISPRATRIVN